MSSPVQEWIARHQGEHRCACGCGQPIQIKRHHHNRGIPAFKKGHMNRGAGNGQWRGGVIRNVRGYRLIYQPDHPSAQKPNGYVLEHRLIAERILGRLLTAEEDVHHLNENRSDNRLDNLTVLSRADHLRIHRGKPVQFMTLAEIRHARR